MRLKSEQVELIKASVARHFGASSQVWLFGSRADDARRGGDVDLYVQPGDEVDIFSERLYCLMELERDLPYPVDMVVDDGQRDRPIYRIARSEGISL